MNKKSQLDYISEFVKTRNEAVIKALMENDFSYMKSFIKKTNQSNIYGEWLRASDTVKMATVCKMACNIISIDEEIKEKARKWLKENNMSEDIKL